LSASDLERLSLQAWPAKESIELDGWLVCLSDGYTRRTNSVQPLEAGSLDSEAKIERCEAIYRRRGQRVVFKLTADVQPHDLDERLARRGYERRDPTSVQRLALAAGGAAVPEGMRVETELSEDWFECCLALNRVSPSDGRALRGILERIAFPLAFAALEPDGTCVAQALGVLQDRELGLFLIATDPGERRRGFQKQLLAGLFAWAFERGARSAWLQVVVENAPAMGLYRKLGFRETYRYWYRMRD
jgi:ribosomal protein S18 acetylase RimI-like enzyme